MNTKVIGFICGFPEFCQYLLYVSFITGTLTAEAILTLTQQQVTLKLHSKTARPVACCDDWNVPGTPMGYGGDNSWFMVLDMWQVAQGIFAQLFDNAYDF